MTLVLPTIRADFGLVENYVYRPSLRLPLPLTVFAGRGDEHVQADQVEGWRAETTGQCAIQWFEGDHFFINEQREAVVEHIAATLEQLPGLALECGAQRMTS
jgi:medium-chain acyl-[acyl-carrier-protein] hydrolase